MLLTRPSHVSDAYFIAPRLRPADRAEVQAASGLRAHVAINRGLKLTVDPITGITAKGGHPVCIGGVVPDADGIGGCIWMLGTTLIEDHALSFLRKCSDQVDAWNARWPLLYNLVDERNELHIRWLRWMGFTFTARHERWGHEQRPFLFFARTHV